MITVNLSFMFFAGVVFLGFVVTALFDKFRITSVLPLMFIGLIIGPVLKIVNSSPGSTIAQLTPYVTAITVSFVLFDVGININYQTLKNILLRATGFMSLTIFVTAFAAAVIAFYAFGWTLLESFVFGFSIGGPSSIIVPTLLKSIKMPRDLKTTLLYEGIATDSFQLIIPIMLLGIIASGNMNVTHAASLLVTNILSSVALGFISALFWLYVLNKFRSQSKEYSWMLTIAMVIATYGIAENFGMSGAIAIFVFGISFANIDQFKLSGKSSRNILLHFLPKQDINYIKRYQKEVTFFASTFFFVYIGMLFNITNASNLLNIIIIGVGISIVLLVIRAIFTGTLSKFMHRDKGKEVYKFEKRIVTSDVGRGLSSAIVATLPLSFGIVMPGFIDEIFIIILFTNIISALGIFLTYNRIEHNKKELDKVVVSKKNKNKKKNKKDKKSKK